ncbi:prepilin-type N-terminal cleavage/methylation domain-containing protein [Chitinibacter sp. S2-10]|uniref:prepilin-type N-terminal cleavage/methylation domain-containing protein n=1 Tax=Chitinibacter sp. S2-10 TaxID=3373597 RepID=UPI0039777DB3
MKAHFKRQSGLSLIELLISLAIGLLLLSAIIAYFYGSLGAQKNVLREMNLSKEMRFAENLLISELRRSGFYPASLATPNLSTLQPGIYSTSCILSSYYTPDGSTLNYSGFRFISNQLQMRNNAAGKCSDAADSGNWESLIDSSRITITAFSITSDSASPGTLALSYEARAKGENGATLSSLETTKLAVSNLAVEMFNVSAITTLTSTD